MTSAEAFRQADQRLYEDKRASRVDEVPPAPDGGGELSVFAVA
jgi:hypothetical protein